MSKFVRNLLASAAIAGSTASFAAPITLTLTGPLQGADQTQQTFNNPCFFGDPSCSPGLLGTKTVFPAGGGGQTYQETQSYALSTVRSAVGNRWDIGIDVNTTEAAGETLDLFTIKIDGVVIYTYSGGANIAAGIANGTGFSDWLLSAVDLTGLVGTTLTFDVKISNATDGREQLFIIDRPETPVPVPLPGSLALLGLGLLALSRRKAS